VHPVCLPVVISIPGVTIFFTGVGALSSPLTIQCLKSSKKMVSTLTLLATINIIGKMGERLITTGIVVLNLCEVRKAISGRGLSMIHSKFLHWIEIHPLMKPARSLSASGDKIG
jgi:hypothetical protein